LVVSDYQRYVNVTLTFDLVRLSWRCQVHPGNNHRKMHKQAESTHRMVNNTYIVNVQLHLDSQFLRTTRIIQPVMAAAN